MYYQIQRYKFESNSQLVLQLILLLNWCIIKYKDTNLKAIHNECLQDKRREWVYYQIQRYKFESNSQQANEDAITTQRCIIKYKDTNLKAIHNYSFVVCGHWSGVLSNTKIQI